MTSTQRHNDKQDSFLHLASVCEILDIHVRYTVSSHSGRFKIIVTVSMYMYITMHVMVRTGSWCHTCHMAYVYILTPATVAVPEVLPLHWGCSHTPPSRLTHRTTTLTQPSAHAPKWPLLATNWYLRNHRENDPWWLKIEGCWGLAVNFPSDCPKWPSAGAWLSVNWFHPLKYNESLPA